MKKYFADMRLSTWNDRVTIDRVLPMARQMLRSLSSGTHPDACLHGALARRKVPLSERLRLLGASALLLISIVAGCATVDVIPAEQLHQQQFVDGTEAVAHVYVDNWGWYLFKVIPIMTGNLDKPGLPRLPRFFTDNVQPDHVVEKVAEESQKLGGVILSDVRVRDRSEYMPFTLFFWLNEFEASANVSRPGAKKGKNERESKGE